MVIDSIRALNHAAPFRPYLIRMTSGETHGVPHPEFILVSPDDTFVIVVDERYRPHHLSSSLIEEVVPLNPQRRGGRRRKAR